MTGQEPNGENPTPMPEAPQVHPEDAVDALEQKVTGETHDQRRDEDDTDRAAFEQDIEPTDAAADAGGHIAGEPPS